MVPDDSEDPGSVLCLYKTDDDCVMKFMYSEHASGRSVLTALEEPECGGGGPEAPMVLLAVVGSILMVGVVLLAPNASTHFVETDFNSYGKSFNGEVH
ncbi:Integrin beta-5 [Liparis tanakae]|uniref:Integrin beta-5 n=1 Tax=Liparis tanakae TaxID=230148 RepID=A0A4Z2G374_9TELE|nr:Integrin beta-5 [Liparis tanakae]